MGPAETIENDAVFDRFGAVFDRLGAENGAKTIENAAETKHLYSTRTARPPKGPGSSSRIQMLKSSLFRYQETLGRLTMIGKRKQKGKRYRKRKMENNNENEYEKTKKMKR